MSRFLFVVPPLQGHVNPASALAEALTAGGHEVAWTGSEKTLRPLLGPGALIYPTGTRIHRTQADSGLASVKSVWERFIVPFARFTLPAVDKAVRDYRPDVILSDQITPAGALVAHRHGLPWASLICSTIELGRPFRALPKVESWLDGQLETLWNQAGLPASERFDLRFSPFLVIAFTTAELTASLRDPDDRVRPGVLRPVGPSLGARVEPAPAVVEDWLDPARRHVLVTMGTLAAEVAEDFYARALAALAPMAEQLQAIVLAPPGAIADPPEHVLVLPSAPVLRLLPRLDAVLCHGGLNTVCEALAWGVPLVVAPIRHDQPINAGHVALAGAGLRVSFARASPVRLRAALQTVLDDNGYRQAATGIAASFATAGGAAAAAAAVSSLAEGNAMTDPQSSSRAYV